jgi:YgiT-type zinc finger domain-containing protein
MQADWEKCPLCGSPRIQKKAGTFSVKTGRGAVRIPRIEYHECAACGERFFDYQASRIIDEYCLPGFAVKRE